MRYARDLRTVYFLEVFYRSRLDNVEDGDDVLAHARLTQEFEEFELSQCSQAEHRVVEGGNLLDCNFATTGFVNGGTDNTVRAFTDDIEYLVVRTCGRSVENWASMQLSGSALFKGGSGSAGYSFPAPTPPPCIAIQGGRAYRR